MKLNGHSLQSNCTSVFQLSRGAAEPLTLTLQPLSLGFHQRLRERGIQPPSPPIKISRDSSGKPIRDSQGQALTLSDRQHPGYLSELERYHQTVAVLSVVEALQADSTITFESISPETNSSENWQAYAEAVFTEMELAGFTAGDLILLCREICRLSNLLNDHLQQARANFSPHPQDTAG